MSEKVDIQEVSDLSDKLNASVKTLNSQLETVEANVNEIISMESFSGKAATKSKNYFSELHVTVLKSMNELFNNLDSQLKQHLESFQSNVDNSVKAIIDMNYLRDIEMDINEEYGKLENENDYVRNTINSVSDISSVVAPVFTNVINDKIESVETIIDLEEKLSSFTESNKDSSSETNSLIQNIEATISRASKNTGEARFSDYQSGSSDAGLTVLKEIINSKNQEQIDSLNNDEKEIINKAKADHSNGLIDKATLDSIISGVIATGTAFVHNSAVTKLTNEVSEKVASSITQFIQRNTWSFVDEALVLAPVHGNVQTITNPPSIMSKMIRTGARYGAPIIGSAIDFGIQIYKGENVTDAAFKTAGHLGAAMTGAAIGTAIGGPLGTVVGFSVGVAGSMLIDIVYDNKDKILESVKNIGTKVGDAVSGFFGDIGSVFG